MMLITPEVLYWMDSLVVTSGEFEFVDGFETGVTSGVVGGDIVQGLRHHPVEVKDEHVWVEELLFFSLLVW